MDLTIIIVSYNTCELVRHCLNSLQAHPPACAHQIIVVDNASVDDTVEMIRRDFPTVTVFAETTNTGYAAAVNRGLRHAESGYALILNSDIEVSAGTTDALLGFMENTPRAGMCGPQLILPGGQPQQTWRRGFTLGQFARQQFLLDKLVGRSASRGLVPRRGADEGRGTSPRPTAAEVEHLDGAALLVRMQAVNEVGLMDEGYWMYCEDSDWSLRVRLAGWTLHHVPGAAMLHHHGASSRQCRADMIAAYNRAAARYFRLHEGALAGLVARGVGLTGTALRLTGWTFASLLTLGLVRPATQRAALFLRALDLQVRRTR